MSRARKWSMMGVAVVSCAANSLGTNSSAAAQTAAELSAMIAADDPKVHLRKLEATIGRDGMVLDCTRTKGTRAESVDNGICAARAAELSLAAKIVAPAPRLFVRITEATVRGGQGVGIAEDAEPGRTLVAGLEFKYTVSADMSAGRCPEAMVAGAADRLPVELRMPPCRPGASLKIPTGWNGDLETVYRLEAAPITPVAIENEYSEVIMIVDADDEIESCTGDKNLGGTPRDKYCALSLQAASGLRYRDKLTGRIMLRFVSQSRFDRREIASPSLRPGEKIGWQWLRRFSIDPAGEVADCHDAFLDHAYGQDQAKETPCPLTPIYDPLSFQRPAPQKIFALEANTTTYRALSSQE